LVVVRVVARVSGTYAHAYAYAHDLFRCSQPYMGVYPSVFVSYTQGISTYVFIFYVGIFEYV
jgi:citrate synthase